MSPEWYSFALREIEKSCRRLNDSEQGMIQTVKQKIELGFSMTKKQEDFLLAIHKRCTEVKFIDRRGR